MKYLPIIANLFAMIIMASELYNYHWGVYNHDLYRFVIYYLIYSIPMLIYLLGNILNFSSVYYMVNLFNVFGMLLILRFLKYDKPLISIVVLVVIYFAIVVLLIRKNEFK